MTPRPARARRRSALAASGLAVAVLAGCGASGAASGGPASPAVLAAEDVFAADPVVEPGPDGTTATLRLTTEIAMACAMVFGTTEDLGDGIATDNDMDGGAHTEHAPVVSGLEPGTQYYYRLQGSGADGNLYRSDLMTFTTPDVEQDPPPGPEVGVGAEVVDVSSEFSADLAAENAVDGDLATAWSTAGDGDDASITLDLGEATDLSGIALRSRSMGDGSSVIASFTVRVDGGEPLGPFDAGTAGPVAPLDVTGQVLQVDAVTTSGGNTGAAEIAVYGR